MYDIIGDIHGHADELKSLLKRLGYILKGNTFSHPTRKVLFLGDYIDRGQQQKEVITIVRNMVDAGNATAIIGNHEYNAILFSTNIEGEFLRKHSENNLKQHKSFLNEYSYGSNEYYEVINWFKSLPFFFENYGFKAVHAAWLQSDINFLNNKFEEYSTNLPLQNYDFLNKIRLKGNEYHAIENILKGIETFLPNNLYYKDGYGIERNTLRLNWFCNKSPLTYKDRALSLPKNFEVPNIQLEKTFDIYTETKPVFFGHYWLSGDPAIQHEYAACLDYSVAAKGKLVCYRWHGETQLSNENFFF